MIKKYIVTVLKRSTGSICVYLWICTFCVCTICGCTKKEQLLPGGISEETVILQKDAETVFGNQDLPSKERETAVDITTQTAEGEKREIYVHICGAVNSSGVFVLPEGSRVFDAVSAAGGFTEDASRDYINQALVLTDGCKIQIPTVEEVQAIVDAQYGQGMPEVWLQGAQDAQGADFGKASGGDGIESSSGSNGKVNINAADAALLCTLNGIGEGRAAAIIKYRESHGGFGSIEEIMNVAGIKQGVFEKIKDQISVK